MQDYGPLQNTKELYLPLFLTEEFTTELIKSNYAFVLANEVVTYLSYQSHQSHIGDQVGKLKYL